MDTFFKVAGWITAVILGAAVWTVFPEYQTIMSGILVVLIICYLFSVLVQVTVKRQIGDELQELRLQTNATAERIGVIDRKVTAVLRDALEQRQARTQTLPLRPVASAQFRGGPIAGFDQPSQSSCENRQPVKYREPLYHHGQRIRSKIESTTKLLPAKTAGLQQDIQE